MKMKKFLIATGIVLATASGAFAKSGRLDFYNPMPAAASKIDHTATAAIDHTATAAIDRDDMAPMKQSLRLGNSAPAPTTGHESH
jgi:hypothetical protein